MSSVLVLNLYCLHITIVKQDFVFKLNIEEARLFYFNYYFFISSNGQYNYPMPIKVFHNLNNNNNETVFLIKKNIKKESRYIPFYIYSNKRYIGSAKGLYLRLIEHLSNKKSNTALQSAILKNGLDNFEFYVYEYFTYYSKVVSNKALTDLDTSYIKNILLIFCIIL